jgi:DNA-binding transcriptional ArsR family regulator
MEIKTAVVALAALAQETRLSVYRALVQAGPQGLAAGRIAELLGVPAATLSFHLAALGNADLIAWRQQGRFVIYTANYASMNALLAYLTEHCCAGNPGDCLTVDELAASRCCPETKPAARTPRKKTNVRRITRVS